MLVAVVRKWSEVVESDLEAARRHTPTIMPGAGTFERGTPLKLTLALILVEWAAGMTVGLAYVHRLHRVGPGFTWLLAGAAAAVATLAAVAGVSETGAAAAWRTGLSAALATGSLALVVLARRAPFAFDALVVTLGAAAIVAAGVAAGGGAVSVARSLAGAAFLGTVTTGLVIGHWYLVDTSLPRDVIRQVTLAFLVGTLAEAAALIKPMIGEVVRSGSSGFTAALVPFWFALFGLVSVLGFAVLGALREQGYPAVMAATGLFYLAVITAFGVDVLAKAVISGAL